MVALKIEDRRAFTSGLFIGELFDSFLVREVSIVTFNRFTIDGRVRHGYYSDEELEENRIEEFSAWRMLRPVCFSLIKGKRLPESFRMVFLLPPSARERFAAEHAPGLSADSVGGLYVNVSYENDAMTCVTGVSLNLFTTDRTLEREWDEAVERFFRKNGIAVSK